jgi:hypothetical protein
VKFVATNTADQFDLQALHQVRERLVGQRTGVINQIRAFPLDGASPCGKACVPCGPSSRVSSRRTPMCSRLACCASSRIWRETGAG